MKKLLLTVALTAAMPMAFAQTALSVNGQTISAQTQKEVMAILQNQGMTDEKQRLNLARNALIERTVVAQEVRKLKLDQNPALREKVEGQKHAAYLEALGQRYFKDKKPTQKDLDAAYKELKEKYDPTFIQLSEIVVKTEAEAKEIIEKLNKGGDFAALAKEKSLDPHAKESGGVLPLVNIKQLEAIPGLTQAALTVDPGKVLQAPYKVREGYAIVRIDKKEQKPLPPEKDLEKQLTEIWARNQFNNYITGLVKEAKINEVAAAAPAPAKK